jgi:hypothetical protein
VNCRIIILAGSIALAACGQESPPVDEPAQDAAAEVAATATADAKPPVPATLPRTSAPEGASIFFVSPENGATTGTSVKVVFGAEGVGVAAAGTFDADTGHHHVLIDTGLPDLGMPIPADDRHVHFGKAQTETTLTLEPGTHTLQMLMGDGLHIPHDPPLMSEQITITVVDEAPAGE